MPSSFHERSYDWNSAPNAQPPAPPVPEAASNQRTNKKAIAQTRVWKSIAGKTLAEGRAFVVADGRVGISKTGGGTMTLIIADLADTDRQYLAGRVADPSQIAKQQKSTPRLASR